MKLGIDVFGKDMVHILCEGYEDLVIGVTNDIDLAIAWIEKFPDDRRSIAIPMGMSPKGDYTHADGICYHYEYEDIKL